MTDRLRPTATDPVPASVAGYVAAVAGVDVRATLAAQPAALRAAVAGLDGAFRYSPGKWSVAETIGHIADTERVFACRLLRLLRQDPTPLPPFEQDPYVAAAGTAAPLDARLADVDAVRAATLALVDLAPDAAWDFVGTVSGHSIGARTVASAIAGHVAHHLALFDARVRPAAGLAPVQTGPVQPGRVQPVPTA